MIYQDEKTKKILKVGFIVIGVILVYGFLRLFLGNDLKRSDNTLSVGSDSFKTSTQDVPRSSMIMNESMDEMVDGSGMMMEKAEVSGNYESADSVSDQKVIKNGNLSLKVGSADWAAGEISNITREKGGQVFSTNFSESTKGQRSGYMTIKVPVDKFEETLADIKKIATQVLRESSNAQDVTEQYADLQAQLKNKRAEEESFSKILNTAGKIDDILAVTKELSRVRGEVERLEGKIKYMDSQTDMSTITINLSEDAEVIPISDDWRPWEVVKQSAKELISNIQGFVDGIIRFIIVGIPALVPFVILVAVVVWLGKKIFRKMNS